MSCLHLKKFHISARIVSYVVKNIPNGTEKKRCETQEARTTCRSCGSKPLLFQQTTKVGQMKFSVIVPFLNEEKYIRQCIEALLRQDFDHAEREFIFVDNGSDDSSVTIVASFPEIHLLSEPRRDPYLARNRGIESARGEYLLFLDADCTPAQDWLSHMHTASACRPVDILLGNILYPSPAPFVLQCQQDYYNTKTGYLLRYELRPCYYGHAGNMGVKKTVFDEVGIFKGLPEAGDTAILHDLMALRPDAQILHVPEAEVVHLEITGFRHCLVKLARCGRYTGYYEDISGFRALRIGEKLSVMESCAREHDYSLWQRGALFVSLFIGWLAFELAKAKLLRFSATESA
jgi:glycosyltransferase involved in cell wall biosynthesis